MENITEFDLTTNGSIKIRGCWHCQKKTGKRLLMCGDCKTAYYCNNNECQRKDWSLHKLKCKEIKGQGQLRHTIDEFTKGLTRDSIPAKDILGYFIQIKDTNKFNELIANGLDLSDITKTPLIISEDNNNCYTPDESIFVSFTYINMDRMIKNYDFILYLTDMEEDISKSRSVFEHLTSEGKIMLVVYAHDLKHYTLDIMD